MRWLFVFLVICHSFLLAGLGFIPTDQIPMHEYLPQDKILHFSGFLILAFLMFFAWGLEKRLYNIALTGLPLIVLAIGSEFIQPILSPTRSFDPLDMVANSCGVTVGLMMATCADIVWQHSRFRLWNSSQSLPHHHQDTSVFDTARYEAVEMV